ncbi:MAG: hypothetical protein JW703_03220 [Candidatus Diapherotrites archaeon]|nr:hypothetical protein [Candidatus Diapherotrites archaeon]
MKSFKAKKPVEAEKKIRKFIPTLGKKSNAVIKISGHNPRTYKLNESKMLTGIKLVHEKEFNNLFKENEKVLMIELDSINASETIQLIDKLEEQFKYMQQNGVKGLFFDSPNSSLRKYLKKRFNAVEIETPEREKESTMKWYEKKVKEKGFPEKYLNEPIKTIVIKF